MTQMAPARPSRKRFILIFWQIVMLVVSSSVVLVPNSNVAEAYSPLPIVVQHAWSITSLESGGVYLATLDLPEGVTNGNLLVVGAVVDSTLDCNVNGVGCSSPSVSDSLQSVWQQPGSGISTISPYVDIEFWIAPLSTSGVEKISVSDVYHIDAIEIFELANVDHNILEEGGSEGSGLEFTAGVGYGPNYGPNGGYNFALAMGASDRSQSEYCSVGYTINISLTVEPYCGALSGQGQVFGAFGLVQGNGYQIAVSTGSTSPAGHVTQGLMIMSTANNATEVHISCSESSIPLGSSTTCSAVVSPDPLRQPGPAATGTVSWRTAGGGGLNFAPTSCVLQSSSCQVTVHGAFYGVARLYAHYEGDPNNWASLARTKVTVTSSPGQTCNSSSLVIVQHFFVLPTSHSNSISLSMPTNVDTGNYLVVGVLYGSSQTALVSDSLSNTWRTEAFSNSGIPIGASISYAAVVNSGSDQVWINGADSVELAEVFELQGCVIIPMGGSWGQGGPNDGMGNDGRAATEIFALSLGGSIANVASNCVPGMLQTPSNFVIEPYCGSVSPLTNQQIRGEYGLVLASRVVVNFVPIPDPTDSTRAAEMTMFFGNPTTPATVTPTSVTVTCNSPSLVVGWVTSCKASVNGASPTGTVAWWANSTAKFSKTVCTLSNGACSTKYRPTSANSPVLISANYLGDSSNGPSGGMFSLTVVQKASKTTVSCTPGSRPASTATIFTCKARVTGYSPSGIVTWSQAGPSTVSLSPGWCTLAAGTCSVTVIGTSPISVAVRAIYEGDLNNAQGMATRRLNLAKATASLLVSCPTSLSVGVQVICTASVSGGYFPSGNVGWSKVLGPGSVRFSSRTCALSLTGSCSVTIDATVTGTLSIKATYFGDPNNVKRGVVLSLVAT